MSKKLLLADDSITIQKVIQITFAHEDYELNIVDNGDAALAKAREFQPDLVLADVYMPGKNGYELTTAIKQDPALQHVPVLLLAGSFEPFDEEKAVSCKADAWIEKPFESQNLIDKVAELLANAAAAPQPEAIPASVPTEEAEVTFDESASAEPLSAEPALAADQEDPFADISFEEEPPAVDEPVPAEEPTMTAADDWSDVLAETAAGQTAPQDAAETEPIPDEGAGEFGRVEEQPQAASEEATGEETVDFAEADEFGRVEEQPETASEETAEEETVGFAEADAFDMGDEDIIPLEDEDILGAEDLEPIMEEQTLTPWSRAEADVEDFFGGPVEEEVSFEEPLPEESEEEATDQELPVSVAEETAFGEEGVSEFLAVEPVSSEEPAEGPAEEPEFAEDLAGAYAQEPAAEEPDWFVDETPAASDEPATEEEPAAVAELAAEEETATLLASQEKAGAMSEAEIEAIIERVVTRIVEKLAGSIVERVSWEVVPDLAENLIREEIRKIKDAAA